jgi:hypothetical protein
MVLQKKKCPLENCNCSGGKAYSGSCFHEKRLLFFESRCKLLADRIRAGELGFMDGVDMAYSAAQWSGLADAVGDDNVQLVMSGAFMCPPHEKSS